MVWVQPEEKLVKHIKGVAQISKNHISDQANLRFEIMIYVAGFDVSNNAKMSLQIRKII